VLHITFDIEFPKPNWTSEAQLKVLESVLPPRKPLPQIKDLNLVEEVVLSDVDTSRQRQGRQMEDEDEHEGHGPQVQCAQQ
jgi:DnaJ family protein A protein 2